MYSKIRKFNTDIHIYEFNPKELVFTLTAEQNRTPLSKINHDWWESKGKVAYAKINAGYFGWSTQTNTAGVDYRDEGFTFSDTTDDDEFIELVYSGKRLYLFDGTLEDIKAKYPNAEWAVSMGYSLVDNGVKSIRKAERFTHSYQSHPRTMIGQKPNYTIVLCVAEGRNANDKGLTADEQAEVMLELGCVVAVNADGGGSSEMIVQGAIKNYLPAERSIATALMVYGDKKEEPVVTSVSHPVVVGKVQLRKNFTLTEIACRHCGEVMFVSPILLDVAQDVRDYFGVPIRLVGYRCPKHNAEIGGDPNSGHMKGTALDISSWNGDVSPEQLYAFVAKYPAITGQGIYSGHIHIDTHHSKLTKWDNR